MWFNTSHLQWMGEKWVEVFWVAKKKEKGGAQQSLTAEKSTNSSVLNARGECRIGLEEV